MTQRKSIQIYILNFVLKSKCWHIGLIPIASASPNLINHLEMKNDRQWNVAGNTVKINFCFR